MNQAEAYYNQASYNQFDLYILRVHIDSSFINWQ